MGKKKCAGDLKPRHWQSKLPTLKPCTYGTHPKIQLLQVKITFPLMRKLPCFLMIIVYVDKFAFWLPFRFKKVHITLKPV